jgi:hypothetical protein
MNFRYSYLIDLQDNSHFMEIDYLEYNVRTDDKLKSIASRIDMTKEKLELFHNSYCQKMNWIWFENLIPENGMVSQKNEPDRSILFFPKLLSCTM